MQSVSPVAQAEQEQQAEQAQSTPPVAQSEPQAVVQVEQEQQVEQAQSAPSPPIEWNGAPAEIAEGRVGATAYIAKMDRFSGEVITTVGTFGDNGGSLWDGALFLRCEEGQLELILSDLPYITSHTRNVNVQFATDDSQPFTYSFRAIDSAGGDRNLYRRWSWNSQMADAFQTTKMLYVRFRAYRETFNGEFDISDLFNTPAQPNLVQCGE